VYHPPDFPASMFSMKEAGSTRDDASAPGAPPSTLNPNIVLMTPSTSPDDVLAFVFFVFVVLVVLVVSTHDARCLSVQSFR